MGISFFFPLRKMQHLSSGYEKRKHSAVRDLFFILLILFFVRIELWVGGRGGKLEGVEVGVARGEAAASQTRGDELHPRALSSFISFTTEIHVCFIHRQSCTSVSDMIYSCLCRSFDHFKWSAVM